MTHESATATLFNYFDIQVDSNHTWDEPIRTVEVSVYTVSIDADGDISTDSLSSLVHVEIPNTEAVCEDTWFSSEDADAVAKLPERWKVAVGKAIETALATQEAPAKPFVYGRGATVFLPEYRFPAEVEFVTTDGRYVLELANSGELDIFAEDEIEPYNAELWHRP